MMARTASIIISATLVMLIVALIVISYKRVVCLPESCYRVQPAVFCPGVGARFDRGQMTLFRHRGSSTAMFWLTYECSFGGIAYRVGTCGARGRHRAELHEISFPLCIPLALLMLHLVAVIARPRLTARRRLRLGVCVSCGYDLTGSVSGVCPECGVVMGASR
jgi:hypothetical protein